MTNKTQQLQQKEYLFFSRILINTNVPLDEKYIKGAFLSSFFPNISTLLFFCLLFSTNLLSQELHFQHYTTKDGLSYYRIPRASNLIQDRHGFIWIPTFNGLNRFDGREFKIFKNDPTDTTSISNNTSLGLSEAADGKIWISVGKEGVNIYDPITGIFERLKHDPNNPKSLCGNFVVNIQKAPNGDMWLASHKGPVCRCKKGTREFKSYSFSGDLGKESILFTQDSTLYIGSVLGLHQYLPEKDTFILHIPYPEAPKDRRLNMVRAMMEGANGEIWVSSLLKGQKIFNPKTATFRPVPNQLVFTPNSAAISFLKDKDNNLWLGERKAIIKYNPSKEQHRIFQQQTDDLSTWQDSWAAHLLQDQAGSLWVGTGTNGISVTHNIKNPFAVLPNLNYGEELIPLNDHQLLLPTDKGIVTYDILQQKIVPSELPPIVKNANAFWLRLSPTGALWWLDNKTGKTYSYHLKTGKFRTLNQRERFEIDSKGNVWFQKFLGYYDVQQEKMMPIYQTLIEKDTTQKLPTDIHLNWVTLDNQDRAWYSTNGDGFLMIDSKLKKLKRFVHKPNNLNSVAVGSIYRIRAGSNGWIYCRTNTALSIYQPERDTFIHLTEADGMLNTQYLASMEDDNGDWWFATPEGLSKLTLPNLEFQNFDTNDGLPGGFFHWGERQRCFRIFVFF